MLLQSVALNEVNGLGKCGILRFAQNDNEGKESDDAPQEFDLCLRARVGGQAFSLTCRRGFAIVISIRIRADSC